MLHEQRRGEGWEWKRKEGTKQKEWEVKRGDAGIPSATATTAENSNVTSSLFIVARQGTLIPLCYSYERYDILFFCRKKFKFEFTPSPCLLVRSPALHASLGTVGLRRADGRFGILHNWGWREIELAFALFLA